MVSGVNISGPQRIVLDSHALTQLAARSTEMQHWAAAVRQSGSTFYLSAVTLAETTNGTARDTTVRRAVSGIKIIDVTKDIGYLAGTLRAAGVSSRKKPRDLTVDALVAATALSLRPPVVILTSDKSDFDLMLADKEGVRVYQLKD